MEDQQISQWVTAARNGDVIAFGRLVEATQRMVYVVAMRIVRRHEDAMDVTQETYLLTFRRFRELLDDEAFQGWLRRIAVTVAQSHLRRRRRHFLDQPLVVDVPVLDESETRWTDEQRASLAGAMLEMAPDDRLICERFYHGGWSISRLAEVAQVAEQAMRKRLQRIRDRLRKEIEMIEKQNVSAHAPDSDLPGKIIELLARPMLTALPQNPVGRVWEMIRGHLQEFNLIEVPEIVQDRDVRAAFGSLNIWSHLQESEQWVHRIDEQRFLRSELDVPLILAARGRSGPLSLATAGKVYRVAKVSRTHLEAFHQGEVLLVREHLEEWEFMGRIMQIMDSLYPNRQFEIHQFGFPLCDRAWEISVEWGGNPVNLLAWGKYSPGVIQLLGNDPQQYGAIGIGFGLERMACLHFGIDDIRKVDQATISQ